MNNCEDNSNRVTFDPGWNDPPSLSYGMQQTTPNRPRNFLNKRVAFPLTGNNALPVVQPSPNIPPISTNLPPPIIHAVVPVKPNNTEHVEDVDNEMMLKEVKEILLNLLNNYELGSKTSDIKRRISVMENMWLCGKLNNQIQVQMKDLANALQNNQPSIADDIHKALMVDHVSAVSSWMLGIKQLIHHCIARSELLAIDNE